MFNKIFINDFSNLINKIDYSKLNQIIKIIKNVQKNKSRIFLIGVGGSAANCTHAVNDFRKICNINAITPFDNISELTANINDNGWDNSLIASLNVSNLNKKDVFFFLSVGGGDLSKKISVNLINLLKFSNKKGIKSISILGRKKSYLSKNSTVSLILPESKKIFLTPFAESFQLLILHLIVSHPDILKNKTKW